MQRTLSTEEITKKTNQQISTKSSKNIALASRTVAHNAIPPLLNNSRPVDFIIDLVDLSGASIKAIKAFFKTSSGKHWTEKYVQQLRAGKILPMPGMSETTEKMKKVIADFKALYKKEMKLKDCEALTTLQSALDINAANGYPSYDSELLAKKFCVLRDYLVLRYGERGDPQWPIETGADFSISNFGKSKKKLSNLTDCSQQILLDDFAMGDDYQKIHSRYGFYTEIISTIEADYRNHFHFTDSVRILVMDDLSIEDFNQTTGIAITYLGLLQDKSVERHDNYELLSYPLLVHDGYHAYAHLRFITTKQKSIINSVMNEYYNKLKPKLNNEVSKIVDYLFFTALHERNIFFEPAESIRSALKETIIGFGVVPQRGKNYYEKYLTDPLSSKNKFTEEQIVIRSHLQDATDTACHAFKIYSFFAQEAISASENGQTMINKLASQFDIKSKNTTKHTVESLAQMISDMEIKGIQQLFFEPILHLKKNRRLLQRAVTT